jgi:hypothetical protein
MKKALALLLGLGLPAVVGLSSQPAEASNGQPTCYSTFDNDTLFTSCRLFSTQASCQQYAQNVLVAQGYTLTGPCEQTQLGDWGVSAYKQF